MTDEPMDVPKVIELLNKALPLQMRSALQFAWTAASTTGLASQAVGARVEDFGKHEIDDLRRLMEKITALGGKVSTSIAPIEALPLEETHLDRLIELETETVQALADVIPATGNEARSEALEHLLEHIIMRKQNQIDFLTRARGGSEG